MFHAAGADRECILLKPGTASLEKHLASYNGIDIALDTFPYNGTTTTCEALWMGIPVVTLKGNSHPGRVGYSLLTQAGLGSLAATTVDEYITTAGRLAADTAELSRLRSNLRGMLRSSSLCNGQTLQSIEAFYRTAWKNWCYHSANN
jgi:predicted O-linked N-acetylglucosamine transferase (SPINDLY family)